MATLFERGVSRLFLAPRGRQKNDKRYPKGVPNDLGSVFPINYLPRGHVFGDQNAPKSEKKSKEKSTREQGVKKKRKRGRIKLLDLHGYTLDEAIQTIDNFIKKSY